MARPKRENADYFSHDADMRNDPRVKALRGKYGLDGYAVWCMVLEVLTDSDFFKRDIDDLEVELLSADFGVSPDTFVDMLDYMVQIKLLQKLGSSEYLSQKLIERFHSVTEKRVKARLRAQDATESTQSKAKHTKAKHTKAKHTKANTKSFKRPTLEEVTEYCHERKNGIDPQAFLDHYDANGWMRGKTKIKKWKPCMSTWERNNKKDEPEIKDVEFSQEYIDKLEDGAGGTFDDGIRQWEIANGIIDENGERINGRPE
jgi:hypothetical protein